MLSASLSPPAVDSQAVVTQSNMEAFDQSVHGSRGAQSFGFRFVGKETGFKEDAGDADARD